MRLRGVPALVAVLSVVCGCSPRSTPPITVFVEAADRDVLEEFTGFIPYEGLSLRVVDDPSGELRGGGIRVAVLGAALCSECYRVSGGDGRYTVEGGGVLGRQYGLADLFEGLGFGFFHPFDTQVPTELAIPERGEGEVVTPEMERRGLHMHTLHPIEGLYDFWMPAAGGAERARRVMDWVLKNRGNHLQWVSLDDILDTVGGTQQAWRAHTSEIIDVAHQRGLTVGVGVQLFGSGNLQNAFDLLDEVGTIEQQRAALRERWGLLLEGVPFDLVNLSFGEFFAEAPERFLESLDLAYEVLQEVAPGTEVSTVIHVGNDLWVEYQGQELLYYFLAQFADPAIVPWVHSVMFYNLFDDAGGAYHHEEFTEHREFLLARLRAGEPVGYFPESAYWVAFDNPIPTYLPLYVYSRWLDQRTVADLAQAEGFSPLQQHVLFSSGWEWGYWQNDVATLRMNHRLPADSTELFAELFAPLGEQGSVLAGRVEELALLQHEALIQNRLAAYLAGVDATMELGYGLGIVSQPRRVSFAELRGADATARETFRGEVLAGLSTHADDLARFVDDLEQTDLEDAGRWADEIRDGARVTLLRTRFIEELYAAVLEDADGADSAQRIAAARALLEDARPIVQRRYENFHDPRRERLVEPNPNPTMYQYGYLIRSHQLCFWERDLAQVDNLINEAGIVVPGCAI